MNKQLHNCNWIRTCIIALVGFVAIVACTVNEPKFGDRTIDPIQAAILDADMAKNKQFARQSAPAIPNAITKALLQEPALSHTAFLEDKNQQRFDISVNNVPAKDFFMGLIKGTKYNIMVSPDVTGMISLDLKKVTVQEAMDAVRDTFGYEYKITPTGFQVLPKTLETRIFNVNYLNMDRGGNSQTSFGAGEITNTSTQTSSAFTSGSNTSQQTTPSGTVSTLSRNDFWKELKENLIAIIGDKDGRNVVLNPQSGVVIVRAFPNELRSVATYLDDIQGNMNRQVIIEAQVLEVQLNANFQSGINWKLLGVSQGAHAFGTLTDPDNANALIGLPPIPNIPADFSSMATLKFGGGDDFATFIELLNTQGKVNVLSTPRISTTNNQKAVIKVGNDRFFVTNVSSNTTTGTASTESQDVTLTPFFSGIALDVTPQIDSENNITLHIHPVISTVTDEKRIFKVNGKENELPLAASAIRESDSVVHAKSGQVIIIGGLMKNEASSYNASTPGTEHWGPFSALFKSTNRSAAKFELVILLKPIVTDINYNWNQPLKETSQRYKGMKEDFKYDVVKKTNVKCN